MKVKEFLEKYVQRKILAEWAQNPSSNMLEVWDTVMKGGGDDLLSALLAEEILSLFWVKEPRGHQRTKKDLTHGRRKMTNLIIRTLKGITTDDGRSVHTELRRIGYIKPFEVGERWAAGEDNWHEVDRVNAESEERLKRLSKTLNNGLDKHAEVNECSSPYIGFCFPELRGVTLDYHLTLISKNLTTHQESNSDTEVKGLMNRMEIYRPGDMRPLEKIVGGTDSWPDYGRYNAQLMGVIRSLENPFKYV